MTDLRTAAQQALEALEDFRFAAGFDRPLAQDAIDALRAALAQQKDPTDPGNDVDVLREHVRHLERRVRQLHAQQAEPQGCATEEDCTKQPWCRIRGECQRKQAEPVEPVAWMLPGSDSIITAETKAYRGMLAENWTLPLYAAPPRCPNCAALAQQVEPLNLRDPAVQKRLATQWGYVPAAQAEPVEPVEPVAWECKAGGLKPLTQRQYDAQTAATKRHYTRIAPPQRKPLTEEKKRALADKFLSCQPESYEVSGVFDLISAVERAHGIKE